MYTVVHACMYKAIHSCTIMRRSIHTHAQECSCPKGTKNTVRSFPTLTRPLTIQSMYVIGELIINNQFDIRSNLSYHLPTTSRVPSLTHTKHVKRMLFLRFFNEFYLQGLSHGLSCHTQRRVCALDWSVAWNRTNVPPYLLMHSARAHTHTHTNRVTSGL